jgi:hypothetical protein
MNMKTSFLSIISWVVGLSSCTTAYKSTQTPDDLYYSPTTGNAMVAETRSENRYQEFQNYNDDRYSSMKARNYYLWAPLDDYSYWNDSRYDFPIYNNWAYMSNWSPYYNPYWNMWSPYYTTGFGMMPFYGYGYGYGLGYGWNSWYNPASVLIGYKSPSIISRSTSGSYLSAYLNRNYSNNNYQRQLKSDNIYAPGNNVGSLVRMVFSSSPSTNGNLPSNNNSLYRSARTFNTNGNTFTPSSNAGGRSGGFNSVGSSASGSRGPRN